MTYKHPSVYCYKQRICRCSECTAANAAAKAKQRHARIQRLVADPSIAEHGTYNTYNNYGCRCDECRRASYTYRREMGLT